MGRADKSAQVTKAVLVIRLGEYIDYSNAAKKFHCSRMAVIRRIKGLTKTRQEANSFYY
jgi:O6-methylguanine-DNA--protein-cysteine methyltransferase